MQRLFLSILLIKDYFSNVGLSVDICRSIIFFIAILSIIFNDCKRTTEKQICLKHVAVHRSQFNFHYLSHIWINTHLLISNITIVFFEHLCVFSHRFGILVNTDQNNVLFSLLLSLGFFLVCIPRYHF
jgi:hypothetical protein